MKSLLFSLFFLCIAFVNATVTVKEELQNLVLMLPDRVRTDVSYTKTPKSSFDIIKDDCISDPSPTMSTRALSYDHVQYKRYLKSVNGSQIYVGEKQPAEFHSFPFSVDDHNYWCGYRSKDCGDLLTYFRCMLLLFY